MPDYWICPDEGKTKILDELFRVTGSRESFLLDQFIAGGPVDDLSTAGDFTFASYTGYAQVAIARADFLNAVIAGGVGEILKSANPVFTCTAGAAQTIYGLLFRGASSGIIYYGVNYATPISMSPGASDTINPLKVQHKTFVP